MATTTQTQVAATLAAVTDQLRTNAADILALQDAKTSLTTSVASLTADKVALTAALAAASSTTPATPEQLAAVKALAVTQTQLASVTKTLATVQSNLDTATANNNALLAQVAELQTELDTSDAVTVELQAAVVKLVAQAASILAMFKGSTTPPVVVPPVVVPPVVVPPVVVPPVVPPVVTPPVVPPVVTPPVVVPPVVTPPVTVPTGDVIADRLGKGYAEYDHTGEAPFPDLYLRPLIQTPSSNRKFTSEGLLVFSGVNVIADLTAKLAAAEAALKVLENSAVPPDQPSIYARTGAIVAATQVVTQAQWDLDLQQGWVWVGGKWLVYDATTPAGLPKWSTQGGDFSSSEGQALYVPDNALTVDKSQATWVVSDGIGVARFRSLEMSCNGFCPAPLPPWNTGFLPDPNAYQWIQYNNQPAETIGRPIAQARARQRWCNGDLILFDSGFVATVGTVTAFCPTGGFVIPKAKKVTNISVFSGSEFAVITCIDLATGKGQLCVVANWTGKNIQQATGYLSPFYHDWVQCNPGLSSPAIYCGFKILGYIDLGINNPSAVSAITNRGWDRVQAADGNAGTLGAFDLADPSVRALFATGNNKDYLAQWGMAVVISKTENKAVYVDFRALFQGYLKQYTTTQALYDATRPPAGWESHWWAAYGLGDNEWPYTFAGKPEWTPVVTATVDVPTPTSVLVSEHGDGQLAVGCEDGNVRFWKNGPAIVGSPVPVANGQIQLGRNLTCLTPDEYPSQGGTHGDTLNGQGGGFLAVSRGDRRIDIVSDWGPAAKLTTTIRDARLVDPVHVEVANTHGLNSGVAVASDHDGKQIVSYRYTPSTLTNYGGQVFPIEGGAAAECVGVLKLPGKLISACTTNVN